MTEKLDLKNMTYGGIVVAVILSVIGAGALVFVDDSGTTYYLSEDGAEAKYSCIDPDMKSDCVNGVKTNGERCYWDPDNGRRYKKCTDGWTEKIQPKFNGQRETVICSPGPNNCVLQ